MYFRASILLLASLFAGGFPAACGGSGTGTQTPTSPTNPSSSGYFPYQQGWLGADGAYSIPIGAGQSLWIFADTFIGPSSATSRTQATGFIHNSIAISTCTGTRCTFQYYWPGMGTSSPGPVFTAPGTDWFWPMDGFVYHGTLYLALMQMHAQGSGAFGFAYSGAQLASIANYTASPSQWSITYQQLNTGGSAVPGISIVVNQGPNGNPNPADPQGAGYAYFFAGVGSPPYLALLRIPLAQVNTLARPGNTNWQYLGTSGTWEAWQDTATTLPSDNAPVINPGATEMTVRYHASTNQWIAVYPGGLTNQAYYSLSASLINGWGPSRGLYSYPEMQSTNANFTPNVFCYAAKEHIEFETAGQLFFTYACNSTVESDVTNNMNLYHPVVVTQTLPSK
ncbi:MAG: hypothetical protein ABSD70_09530 [Terracidiphilus sp.]|jgi:hypothetical protein